MEGSTRRSRDIKQINFAYTEDITAVSKRQYEIHLKLYAGYVSKANEIDGILANERVKNGNATYSEYRGLKKGQSYALDGVILHELYFKNMGGGRVNVCEGLTGCINKSFGGYDRWLADFKACADSARGWAILAYEQRSGALANILLDTHDEGHVMGAFPILVLDMYEHAYFIDYANNKDEYFGRFMANVNWNAVNKRYEALGLMP